MGVKKYSDFVNELGSATLPLDNADVSAVNQGATSKKMSVNDAIDSRLLENYVVPDSIFVNALLGEQIIDIAGKKSVYVWKTDDSLNRVIVSDSSGALLDTKDVIYLSYTGQGIHLVYDSVSNAWYSGTEFNQNVLILVSAAYNDIVMQLPMETSLVVVKTDSTAHTVTITPPTAYLMAGGNNYVLTTQYQAVSFRLSRNVVYTVQEGMAVYSPAFDIIAKDLNGSNYGTYDLGLVTDPVEGGSSPFSATVTTASNITSVQTIANNIDSVTWIAGVYYGPSATDPTTRRDSSPLQSGDLYFNTTIDRMKVYSTATGWAAF